MNDENDIAEQLEDLEARYEALNRARMTIFDRLDEIEEQLDTLMSTVEPDPERTSYEQMTREQKVHKIRTTLLRQAADTNGRAKMSYSEVKTLFDGHPSDGHAYDLMEYAGELDGYKYETSPNNRVIVKAEEVNDKSLVHSVKNNASESPV
jgi:hypothetical protein